MVKLYKGDCLEVMKDIPDGSIDMILCDLPYGEVECEWDKIIDFDKLWEQYERIIKDDGAIVLTATFRFSLKLVSTNPKLFKYELIWDKVKPSNIFVGKLRPLCKHEYILVFSKGTIANGSKRKMKYYPIMEEQKERNSKLYSQSDLRYRKNLKSISNKRNKKYPKSILIFSNANQKGKVHPTQKPVELLEYLIKTYTNENETVLDNCAGSMSTVIAALNTKRNCIAIEKDTKYFEIGKERVINHIKTNHIQN